MHKKRYPRSEFGDSPRQELIVVDIDQSARPTYACKREGATTGKTSKIGQNCLQWSVAFCAGEVIDQELLVRLSPLY